MAGTLVVDTLKASSGVLATQNGMSGIIKAWVLFAADTSSPSIRGSFNVSSLIRNSTGNYTINYSTAMPSATYAAMGVCNNAGYSYYSGITVNAYATGYCSLVTHDYNSTQERYAYVSLAIVAN